MGLASLAALLYIINRWGPAGSNQGTFSLRDYLGDILALPVYLPLSVILARRLGLLSMSFRLGLSHILGAILVFALIFEGLVPMLDSRSTRDAWDILAYLAGGGLVLAAQMLCSLKFQRPTRR